MAIIASNYTYAQTVAVGINFGNISSLSVGLSTWKWLYIGVSYEASSLKFFPESKARVTKYNFYTPTLFLQSTVTINTKIKAYGAFHYGYYYDNYNGTNGGYNYLLSLGTDVKLTNRLYANGEVGYHHTNYTIPQWEQSAEPNYKTSRPYFAIGVRVFLNNHPAPKKTTIGTSVTDSTNTEGINTAYKSK